MKCIFTLEKSIYVKARSFDFIVGFFFFAVYLGRFTAQDPTLPHALVIIILLHVCFSSLIDQSVTLNSSSSSSSAMHLSALTSICYLFNESMYLAVLSV